MWLLLAIGGDAWVFGLRDAWVDIFSKDAEGGVEEAMRRVDFVEFLALRDGSALL